MTALGIIALVYACLVLFLLACFVLVAVLRSWTGQRDPLERIWNLPARELDHEKRRSA